jgi:DNA helicase-2/ATP-dependent DNA helicase PcrA
MSNEQIQETLGIINSCISMAESNNPAQSLKSLMLLYLPWLPLNEGVGFDLEITPQDGETESNDSKLTVLIQTKNFGNLKGVFTLTTSNSIDIYIICSESFPKKTLLLTMQEESNSHSMNTNIDIEEVKPQKEENEVQEPEIRTLDLFLQQVLLLIDEENDKEDTNKVSLMTIHAAKGLEYPYVYVVGMEENLFPSAMSISNRQELEEERRLFYVAVTRAEKMLTLTHANTRYQYGNVSYQELSRFVDEIDPKYIDIPIKKTTLPKVGSLPKPMFAKRKNIASEPLKRVQQGPVKGNTPAQISAIQIGMRVKHEKFGYGKVIGIEGDGDSKKALIFFEAMGEKQLMLKFAKLTIE